MPSRVLEILFLSVLYDLVEFFGNEVVSETLPLRCFFAYGFTKLLFALFHEFLEGNLRGRAISHRGSWNGRCSFQLPLQSVLVCSL